MTAPGPAWLRWTKSIKNVANTSVLALPDRLLAGEGGLPTASICKLWKLTETDDLGSLESGSSYSAHCKRDPITGNIFNFGITHGASTKLNLYKSDPTGKIVQQATVALDGPPMLHDFVFAGKYLIFFVPPVRLKVLPVLAGISSFSDSLEWKPELGTQILVVDSKLCL